MDSFPKQPDADVIDSDVNSAPVALSLAEDLVVNDPKLIEANVKLRGIGEEVDIQALVAVIKEKRALSRTVEEKRRELNELSKKNQDKQQVDENGRERARELKASIKSSEIRIDECRKNALEAFSRLPNLTSHDVPYGPASANKVLRQEGRLPEFTFAPRSHVDLGINLKVLDMERGGNVAGKGFYYLKNELVLVRQALSNMTIRHLMGKGFIPVMTPLLAHEDTLFGTGYLPFAQGDSFAVPAAGGACLIGTSEQTLVGQHKGEIIDLSDGPLMYVCDSACFRTEAGNYGKLNQGMLRVHQFGKVEQIIFCKPEDSENAHLLALENEEWLLKILAIPYQVVLIASQDMGAPGYKKYDIEGWIPSLNRYVELTSNTNLTDFQTRRLGIRFRAGNTSGGRYPHTISATAFSDRLLVAIMENFQQADGSIEIPEVLRPLVGLDIIKAKTSAK